VMAKGLGSGLPISGIAASSALMEKWKPGSHGGTYGGGSAIASAAALATVQVILEEDLAGNAARRGDHLMKSLRALQGKYSVIGDVRGLGLMVATEFTKLDGDPDAKSAKAIQKACLEQNLLLLTCGTYDNVIRWIPPLVVTDAQLNESLTVFENSLTTL